MRIPTFESYPFKGVYVLLILSLVNCQFLKTTPWGLHLQHDVYSWMKWWYFMSYCLTHMSFFHTNLTPFIWVFPKNRGTPKSSIFIIHYKTIHFGGPRRIFGNIHINWCIFFQDEDDDVFQSIRIPLGHPPVLFGLPGSTSVFSPQRQRVRSGKGPSHREKVGPIIWSLYSDLTRLIYPPNGSKWWFSKGIPLISGKSR